MPNDVSNSEEARLNYERLSADVIERMRIQTELAQGVLRGLTLGNGGAMIALFTFIGNGGPALHIDQRMIWWAFVAFAVGLTATFIAAMGAYFSQSFYLVSSVYESYTKQAEMLGRTSDYDHMTPYERGSIAEWTGVSAAFVALAGFVAGCVCALAGVLV